MKPSIFCFDLESIPHPDFWDETAIRADVKRAKTATDEEYAAKQEEAVEKARKKHATRPSLCKIIAAGYCVVRPADVISDRVLFGEFNFNTNCQLQGEEHDPVLWLAQAYDELMAVEAQRPVLLAYNGTGFDYEAMVVALLRMGRPQLARQWSCFAKYGDKHHADPVWMNIGCGGYTPAAQFYRSIGLEAAKESGASVWEWYKRNDMVSVLEHLKQDMTPLAQLAALCRAMGKV